MVDVGAYESCDGIGMTPPSLNGTPPPLSFLHHEREFGGDGVRWPPSLVMYQSQPRRSTTAPTRRGIKEGAVSRVREGWCSPPPFLVVSEATPKNYHSDFEKGH